MELWQQLLSDNLAVAAEAIEKFVNNQKTTDKREFARTAERYYNAKHDILSNRILYFDEHEDLVEDKTATNIKISHAFFTELVDQKVQFMLSEGMSFTTENEELKAYLDEYLDEDFNLFLNEIVEGAAIKGHEYAYIRSTADDLIKFRTSDMLDTYTIFDNEYREVGILRQYSRKVTSKNNRTIEVIYTEIYTDKDVRYFIKEGSYKTKPDESKELNPRPHVIAIREGDGEILARDYGAIPFYRLANNRTEASDLVPIKDLIDDYDRMACFLSNNLEDYDKPIFVVSGYNGESIDVLRQNIKSRGAVNVGSPSSGGSVDVKTYQIPYEARKAKLQIDKEAIYKFGMGFDSSQSGDGNITNVVIKSRYSLLDLKCNKLEPRLMAMVKWCLTMILNDIERRKGKRYSLADIDVEFIRSTLINEQDDATKAQIEAQTKQTLVQALVMVQPYIDQESFLKAVCEALELDYDEVLANTEDEDFSSQEGGEGVNGEAEPETGRDGGSEGPR